MGQFLGQEYFMKRFSGWAWPFIIILLSTLGATSMAAAETTRTTFKWQVSESAPINFPMEIVAGSIGYEGGSSYVPSKVTLHQGWGWGRSSHASGAGRKPLPNHLGIRFFSYTEDQFYFGSFELPYDKILALFQAGYYSPHQEDDVTYDRVVVGVAPGGTVSVWLTGYNRATEIFSGQADKIEGDWHWIIDNPDITREQFIQMEINDSLSPGAMEVLKENGIPFGRWDMYHRARYVWQPLITGMQLRDERIMVVKYFNGENDYLDYPMGKILAAATRTVPSELVFVWDRSPAKPMKIKLFFDETEIFAAFEKLGGNGQPLQMEMRRSVIKGKNDLAVFLHNEKESIEFKRARLETYGVPSHLQ